MIRLLLIIDAIALVVSIYGFMSGRVPVKPPNILITVFGFIDISMLLGGLFSYNNTRTWLSKTVVATGEVMQYERRESHDSSEDRTTIYFHPTVRFLTQAGQPVTFTSSVGSSQRSHSIGQQIGVRYLPGDPQDAQVDEFMSLWLVPIVMALIGLPMLLASLFLLVSFSKP